jgi:soluble lytic murein transglycosylase
MQIDSDREERHPVPAMSFLKKIIPLAALLFITACAGVKTIPQETPAGVSLETSQSVTAPSSLNYPPTAVMPDPEKGLKTAIEALKGGNADAALVIARRVFDQYPHTQWYGRALFLTMQSLIKLDRAEEADAAMLRVQAEYPDLADYALFLLAEYHYSGGRYSEAVALYEQVAERYPKSLLAARSMYRRGITLLASYSYAAAADVLGSYLRDNPRADNASDARLGLARALTAEARLDEAVQLYRDLWIRYPGKAIDQETERALADLRGGGIDIPEYTNEELYERGRNLSLLGQPDRAVEVYQKLIASELSAPQRPELYLRTGVALYNLRKRDAAIVILEKLIHEYPSDPRVPEALYWTGRAYGKNGDDERAVKTFRKLLDRFPGSDWCGEALYFTGNIHRDANDKKKAIQAYKRLARDYPDSRFADSATWWVAWSFYSSGEYRKAEQALQDLINRYPRSILLNQARYWQGRAAEKRDDLSRASAYYSHLVKKAPYTYYGYRAGERLSRLKAGTKAIPAEMSLNEPADCQAGPCPGDPPAPPENEAGPPVWTDEAKEVLSAHPSYKKTLELMSLEMRKEAAQELSSLQDRIPKKSGMLLGLSKAFFELGDYYHSLLLVLRNYENYLESPDGGASGDVWLLAYPQGYWESVLSYSRKYGQDPYFIAAVIRAESQFSPEALSPAGARGVMQVMPATGEKVARLIPLPGFIPARLFEPDTAINIGAWYIGSLMKRFKGDPLLVAAAYNAGPEAVQAWISKNGYHGEGDVFVESIPYYETRGYVKKVLRNYAEYRRIYGKAPAIAPGQARDMTSADSNSRPAESPEGTSGADHEAGR